MKAPIKACVNCGMCCMKWPCGFGEPREDSSACKFLKFNENGLSSCGKYKEIIKDPTSIVSPAFGSGCCMGLFNERRERIIATFYDGKEQFTEEYLEL